MPRASRITANVLCCKSSGLWVRPYHQLWGPKGHSSVSLKTSRNSPESRKQEGHAKRRKDPRWDSVPSARMKKPARMTKNPAKWWLNSLSFLSAKSLLCCEASNCVCLSMAIDIASCPAWTECMEWSCAEARGAIETSSNAKTTVVTEKRESASRLRKVIASSCVAFLVLPMAPKSRFQAHDRESETRTRTEREPNGVVHMALHHALDIFATNLGTRLRGIKRCAKTLNLLRAPGTVSPPPLASTRRASSTTSSGV